MGGHIGNYVQVEPASGRGLSKVWRPPLCLSGCPSFPPCLPLTSYPSGLTPSHCSYFPLAFPPSPVGPLPAVGPFVPATGKQYQDQGHGALLWWGQPELLNVNQKVVLSPYKPANQFRGSGHAV